MSNFEVTSYKDREKLLEPKPQETKPKESFSKYMTKEKKQKEKPSPMALAASLIAPNISTLNESSSGIGKCGVLEKLDELSEISDQILLELSHMESQGESTTTMTITTENPLSIFNHAEIDLTLYENSPLSYRIEFFGAEEATLAFAAAFPDLEKFLKERYKNRSCSRVEFSLKTEKKRVQKPAST
ncbi:MAG: hypothetical protein WDZ28_02500 [Simkaniaceae bacterium]